MPDPDTPGTKYGRVRAHIMGLIEGGTIKVGDNLPGEVELAQRLSVSRNTVRHAFSELVQNGLVERTRRKGTIYTGGQPALATSRAIGIIYSSLSHTIYPELLHGVEDGLYRGGYSMILANGNYDHGKERECIRRMLDQGIAGLVIEPHNNAALGPQDDFVALLNDLDLPIVTTNCVIPGLRGSAITVDDRQTGKAAADYLISLGHRRIGCVYKTDAQAGVLRFEGYRDSLREAGLSYDEALVRSFDESLTPRSPGALLTKGILEAAPTPPTAVFYFNDETALQAYDYLDSAGIKIPDGLSLIAVDNIRESSLLSPPLTTLGHPKYVLGKLAAELLLAQMNPSPNRSFYTVRMQLELIRRGSVADLR